MHTCKQAGCKKDTTEVRGYKTQSIFFIYVGFGITHTHWILSTNVLKLALSGSTLKLLVLQVHNIIDLL